ncbi:IS66 family insertion sequence element accessory protein TnpB [uncultured Ruegeria sp.]|nr:IS66 family insertion sequence element accessory protein TnpB [uncultured Ruegeria sp.]
MMTYKRIEDRGFEWPQMQDGVSSINKSRFEALFEELEWKRVTPR